jgi:hypothetical protein
MIAYFLTLAKAVPCAVNDPTPAGRRERTGTVELPLSSLCPLQADWSGRWEE